MSKTVLLQEKMSIKNLQMFVILRQGEFGFKKRKQ